MLAASFLFAAATVTAPATTPSTPVLAIVAQDQSALRPAARDSAAATAQLMAGELLEVRGERLDYLQVWDHQRERGGFVRSTQLRRVQLDTAQAPALLAVLRFVRDTPGSETLGIGYGAAWLRAAPKSAVDGAEGIEVMETLGSLADRLARRASAAAVDPNSNAASSSANTRIAAQLDAATRLGLRFVSYEQGGRMAVCYEGELLRRVLALPATAEQRTRAALALTRPECMNPAATPSQQRALNAWRAQALDRADAAEAASGAGSGTGSGAAQAAPAGLPPLLKNRLAMRRASVWSALAYQHMRSGEGAAAQTAAQRALTELAAVNKDELAEEDQPAFNDAAMRVNASRWAALPNTAPDLQARGLLLSTRASEPGQTCVQLHSSKSPAGAPLAERCSFGLVWLASASLNREANALALAVQPMDAWRETWVFRKTAQGWAVQVLPPSTLTPEVGYSEFAGWVPGGQQMLAAREARGEGRYRKGFEVIRLDDLGTERRNEDASAMGPFLRWQDAAWKARSVALR